VVVVAAGEAKEEEEDGKKGMLKKQAHGRLVWRQILFASKKIQSIIILNTLTVIYGTRISFGLIPTCVCSSRLVSSQLVYAHFHSVRLMWRPRTGEAACKDPAQGHRGRS
jgi:hypothetical protein